jgi:glycosyltransferase involved in cell wall biosynthesis
VEWKLPFTTSYHTKFPEYISARFPVPVQVGYAYMKWFHKPSGRLMVATPTLRDELVEHGFRNVSPWSRGVDTEMFNPDLPRIYHELGGPNGPGGDWPRPFWLNVGRVAVEKNIETFLEQDLPGTKIVVGDGPARAELEQKYPEAKVLGARFGEELARCFRDADVFVFPSWTDTFGLVILEAMATGTPVAAFPAHGPIDIIPGSGAGAIDDDLRVACMACLDLDRADVRAYAEKFSWRASAEQFVENLEPYPEPERGRFWRRLRRITRLRRRSQAA